MRGIRLIFLFLSVFFICLNSNAQDDFLNSVLKVVAGTSSEVVTGNDMNKKKDVELQKNYEGDDNIQREKLVLKEDVFKVVSPHPDLKIEVQRCVATGTTVVIDMVITNYGRDREISFYGGDSGSEVFDDMGNKYREGCVWVGVAGHNFQSYSSSSLFPNEVSINVRLQIEEVSEAVIAFPRIYLKGRCNALGFSNNKPIIIHNLFITR